MTTGTTGQLGLALPVQGELSGTWGDTVNNGITQYTNIAIAGTLTLTGDGAVTLANTTGDASASNITSSLSGAGTVTAQFAVVKISGTTTTKTITGPSYSKTYVVDNAGSYAVTFKASGQTGVTIDASEKCTVYYNGTDYVKVASSVVDGVSTISFGSTGLTPATATSGAVTVAGTLAVANGGTGQTTASAAFNALSPVTTTGDLIIGNGSNSATRLPIGANNYVLTSNGTTASWQASTGGVTSFSAGTTGLTPNTGTTGAVTLAGTLNVANGGTGATSLTANNVLLGNGTSALQVVAPGTSGNVLTSNGTTWTSVAGATGDVTLTGSQTLTNKTIEAGIFTNGYTEEVATANTSTAYTIDLANGSVQILTLTGNCTYTFPTATAGKSFMLLQKQDATGSRTVTWAASVKWPSGTAPTITSTASKGDKFVFTADGTYWWGSVAGQNYL